MVWNEYEIKILIEERRNRNEEYWNIAGNSRTAFWESVASKINLQFQSGYTGHQCKDKFQNLIRDHMVRKNDKMALYFLRINIYRFLQFFTIRKHVRT